LPVITDDRQGTRMTTQTNTNGTRPRRSRRLMGWSIPVLLLLVPLATGAPWTPSDYVVAGVLFTIVGLGIELAVRLSNDIVYRVAAAVAVVTGFLLVWVNIAVGFLGDEENPANLMFFGLLGLTLIGALAVRFRASGLARLLVATTVGQVLIGVAALTLGLGASGDRGVYEAVMGTSMFTVLWLASAWLFARAARREAASANVAA
jgi:hypothetical protein